MPLAEVNSQLSSAIRSAIFIAVLVLVMAVILGYILSGSFSKPIIQLRDIAQKIATGDMSQNAVFRGSTEVRSLSESINSMAGSIKDQMEEIEQRNQLLQAKISEHETMQMALSESEVKYRSLFDNMINGLALHEIIVDSDGQPVDYVFKEINASFEKLTGLDRKTTIGKRITEVIPNIGKDKTDWIKMYGKVALKGIKIVREDYTKPLDRWYNISAFSPKVGYFATAIEEITERKKAERDREILIKDLEIKNAELERFTYTVSHDLKSPLITIKGFLGMLASDAAGGNIDRMESDIKRISRAADKMQRLLDELLELSRIGRIVKPSETVLFKDLAQSALDSIAGRLTEKNAKIELDTAPVEIKGDISRLMEVMENLIDNAAKFSGDREQTTIMIGSRQEVERTVYFVKDNGVGIKPRYQEKIFGLFDKLNQNVEGTGIGLAIAKRVLEVHGGQIWVESEGEDKGSTFCFTVGEISQLST